MYFNINQIISIKYLKSSIERGKDFFVVIPFMLFFIGHNTCIKGMCFVDYLISPTEETLNFHW